MSPVDRSFAPTPPRTHHRTPRRSALTGLLAAVWLAAGAAALAAPGPATVRAPAPPAAAQPQVSYRLPVPEAEVVALFRRPAGPWSAGHRGVDLAAEVGDAVLAPGPGVVAFVGTVVDRSVLTIVHPDGLRSSLEPVVGVVPVGAEVAAGALLGTVQDAPGHCVRTCLHWGVRQGAQYLDPLGLLPGAGPVVLLG